ncbi:MAG: SAM-dependent methyltransferase [Polaribacter sp.]|jgi:SAM-dependent methyltransferase
MNKLSNSEKISLYWDQLYRQLKATNEPALWEVPPSMGVIPDFAIFESSFNSNLPVVDVGCGSGFQTNFLASKYAQVVGIDASKKAIAMAQKMNDSDNATFQKINLLDEEEVGSFCTQIGNTNVYVRGVLHQIPIEERPVFIKHLKQMMGTSGTLFIIETAPNIQQFIESMNLRFTELPVAFKKVFTSHYPPLGVSIPEIQEYFKLEDYELIDSGPTILPINLIIEKNKKTELPAVYALIKKK